LRKGILQKIVTASQMQAIDQSAIRKFGIPGLVLMENAGRGVVHLMRRHIPELQNKKVTVVAGKGNNGGDGFVIARHLFHENVDVQILLAGKRSQLKDDARTNANIAFKLGIPIAELTEKNLNAQNHSLRHTQVIVDALFGTGLTRPASGLTAQLIEKINSAQKFVVAVDIPSGFDSNSGRKIGPCVSANLTAALALFKRSHLLFPAAENMGNVYCVDIGIPQSAIDMQKVVVELLEDADIRSLFPQRARNAHKGTYGHTLVMGGSKGKGGAAGLAAMAALRIGSGLVTLAMPESCNASLEFCPLEAMSLALPETKSGSISSKAVDRLLENLKGKSALAIGPGMSTDRSTLDFMEAVLPQVTCPVVIDADGLNGLAQRPQGLKRKKSDWILTPHPKEMSRLTGLATQDIVDNRIDSALEFAKKKKVTLLLKGARTIIASPEGTVAINPTGNPGMATGGSGDVLTGMIAGLLSQGLSPRDATCAGAYLHGLAGDIYAERNSQTSLIAGDLYRTLPEALKHILP